MISIIVPALNEELSIARTVASLDALEGEKELLVADGGSTDATIAHARQAGARVLSSPRGRGPQMHTGALASQGGILWFVHADTIPPRNALAAIEQALADSSVAGGNFGLVFHGSSRASRFMTRTYPWLRRIGLCYGDAGIFLRRSAYDAIGGFRPFALFEDLDLIARLRRHGRFVHLDCTLTTSSRRFENRNFAAVWATWIALQILYWIGVSPNLLARWYRHVR